MQHDYEHLFDFHYHHYLQQTKTNLNSFHGIVVASLLSKYRFKNFFSFVFSDYKKNIT